MKGIWTIILVLSMAVLWSDVRAEGGNVNEGATQVAAIHPQVDASFYATVKGVISLPDPLLVLTPTIQDGADKTEQQQKDRLSKIQSLVKAISAVEDREVGLKDKDKLEIAEAALSAQERTGVDAVLMIAVARMESDFRRIALVNPRCKYGFQQIGCFADCGMTQHHIRGNARYVISYCKALAKNTKEAFFQSATEIASHVKWCHAHAHQPWSRPLRQCVLNRYNMGPAYKTKSKCRKWHSCDTLQRDQQWETVEAFTKRLASCKIQQRRCILRSSYWERVSCFEYGARRQVRSTRNCRWCTDITRIQSFFYKGATPESPSGIANKAISAQPGGRGAPQ